MYKMLVVLAHEVANDEKISARDRLRELRAITNSAAKLMPRARLYRAEQTVLNRKRDLEQRARDRRGAKLVPRPREEPTPVATDAPEERDP